MKVHPMTRKSVRLTFGLLALSVTLIQSKPAHADIHPLVSRLGVSVGGAWTVGQLGNSEMGLDNRTMNNFALGVLPTYRINRSLLLGVGFDYFWQGQLTSVESAGGTNLRGEGYIAGLGARYFISDKWAIQGNLNFVGSYNLTQNTHVGEDDYLSRPFGARVKGQYFFSRLPITLDAVVEYVRWSRLTVSSTDLDKASSQWMVGVGLTYHFGDRGELPAAEIKVAATPAPAPTPAVEAAPAPSMEAQLNDVMSVTKTDKGSMVNLSGDVAFPSSSSELNAAAVETLNKIADIVAKDPSRKIRIEGHSDSSGNKAKNQTLSQERAEAVKNVFVQRGVNAENVTAEGFGQSKPLVSNAKPEGRAKNRRVEIYVQD